ncbi:hypothetical protein ACLUUI_04225 [Enterobacterales bacterium AW_CKDN230030176-1A_HGKHYDSX7]
MADPTEPDQDYPKDPYVDDIDDVEPGNYVPHPDDPPHKKGPDWPEGQVAPEDQSSG